MLGDNIRAARKSKKISINKVSEMTGIALGYLSDLENNKAKNPSLEILQKIADALNVSINQFVGKSISSIINNRLAEINMTVEELAKKSKVPLSYINKLDKLVNPNLRDYELLMKISKALNIHHGALFAAFARQDISDDYDIVDADHVLNEDFSDNNYQVNRNKNNITKDPELTEILEQLHKRPEMKMLFSVSKNATKEDIEKAVKIIEALKED